jgi:hypothetical protein
MSLDARAAGRACTLVVLAACGVFESARARTWHVQPDSTGDAATIPAALDSAQLGDVILLGAGVYSWTTQGNDADPDDPSMLRVEREVTLRGESTASNTILDAEGQGRVLRCIDAGALRVENVTLTRGASAGAGAGMLSQGDSRPRVVSCVVRDTRSGEGAPGGGISCANGEIRDSEFRDNVTGVAGFGGGLHCVATRVVGCAFSGNAALGGDAGGGAGGGLWGDAAVVIDCAFDSNRAEGSFSAAGGGLYEFGLGSVSNCTFAGNVARGVLNQGFGGGLYTFASASIEGCVFFGNAAESGGSVGLGGGVYGRRATTLTRCTLLANSSGVHFDGLATIEASIIAWNTNAGCTGSATWRCSNLYGNGDDNLPCGTDGGGNFSADPEFCAVDPAATRNVFLQSDSACAPGNHPQGTACGQIGAAPVGCDAVTSESTTWGHVKSLYR